MSSPAIISNPNTDELIRDVFEKDYGFLINVATRKLRNPELSRDAVQDAFLRAWQARHQYKGTARARTWITKILINQCFGMMRRQACRTIGHEEPIDQGLNLVSTTPGPEEQHYGSMREREFLLAKRALPDILRNAIETYVSGVKITQNGAYKSAKHRAQIALRDSMRDKGY
jgi:RNA polymerase sigma factor (sigma-70 family)